ncbi:MAG: thiol reductant ABC exporter subunit CydD [Candidatus Limnocylindrales bacterium]
MIGARAAGDAPERRLLRHDRLARRSMIVAVVAGVAATMALVAQLIAIALAVAGVFLEGRTLEDVLPLLVLGFVLLIGRTVLGIVGELAARRSAERLVGTLRADLTAHLLRLGPTWVSGERSGEISGVLVGGLEAIDDYVTHYLPARWLAMIVPLLVLVLVLLLDPLSVLVLLFTGPLLLMLLVVIGGRTRSVTEQRFVEMRTLSAFFLDILRGLATLKMFGRSREQIDNLRRISGRYGDATMDVLRTAFQTSLVLEWGATIAIALVAVEIGLRLLDDAIPFERALAVLLIVPEFFLPLRALAVRFHSGSAGRAVIGRVFEILDTPAPSDDRPDGPGEPVDGRGRPAEPAVHVPPRITMRGIEFTYPSREAPALDGATFELRPGESVALVGASGAGKSTVINLLLRFIDPDQGVIEVDGRPLPEVPRASWRASVAWVPQRPYLFDGSVGDNIRLARPDAGEEEVAAAARAANATEFIERLSSGLETAVGEGGARLSGGQRQRLAIARAFLRDAPVLILDEATSQQDAVSEVAIADALDRLVEGRTVLLIAHRLRLAQRADRVVVLEAGRVLEQGPPAELLAAGGAYRRLVDDFGEDEEVDA